jgi:ubiquinone/menaquinone biosynthesis C-methylase UbiE
MSSSASISSYERLADRYDAQRGGLVRGAGFAADIAPWVRSHPVFEIGIGTGAIAKPLDDLLQTTIMGADLSPAMAARAKERLGPVVMVADAQRQPVAASRVGTLVLVWVRPPRAGARPRLCAAHVGVPPSGVGAGVHH